MINVVLVNTKFPLHILQYYLWLKAKKKQEVIIKIEEVKYFPQAYLDICY